jgi:hypothetical protein
LNFNSFELEGAAIADLVLSAASAGFHAVVDAGAAPKLKVAAGRVGRDAVVAFTGKLGSANTGKLGGSLKPVVVGKASCFVTGVVVVVVVIVVVDATVAAARL